LQNELAKKIPALPVSPNLSYATYRQTWKRQNDDDDTAVI